MTENKVLTRLVLLFVLIISIPCLGLDLPVDIYMTYMNFDWDHDHNTNDAIDIRINYDDDYDYPEWKPSVGNRSPFAYCMEHDEPIIKAKFECSEEELVWKIDVEGDIQSGHDIMESINGQIEFPGYGYIYIVVGNLTLEDTFTHVDIDEDLYWSFDIVRWYTPQGTPYDIDYHICTTNNYTLDCYTLLDIPEVPFYFSDDPLYSNSCGRGEPWSEQMLEFACDWASGDSDAITAMEDVTEKAWSYLNDNVHYQANSPQPPSYSMKCLKTSFLLNYTLDHENEHYLNCVSASYFVHVLTRALGINSTCMRVTSIDYHFDTDSLECFGSYSFKPYEWPIHQTVYYNNKVFDPTVKVNPSSPYVPVNMDIVTYKQLLIPGDNWNVVSTSMLIEAISDFN